VGFERAGCKFILQEFNNREFAENFMISVKIDNADECWKFVTEKQLTEKSGIRVGKPLQQP